MPILQSTQQDDALLRKKLAGAIQQYFADSEEIHGDCYDILFLTDEENKRKKEVFLGYRYPTNFRNKGYSLSLTYSSRSIDDFIKDFNLLRKEDLLSIRVEQLFMLYAAGRVQIQCFVGPHLGHSLFFKLSQGVMYATREDDKNDTAVQLKEPLIHPYEFAAFTESFYRDEISQYTAMLQKWLSEK